MYSNSNEYVHTWIALSTPARCLARDAPIHATQARGRRPAIQGRAARAPRGEETMPEGVIHKSFENRDACLRIWCGSSVGHRLDCDSYQCWHKKAEDMV